MSPTIGSLSRVPPVEIARMTNAAARLLEVYQSACLTLLKLKAKASREWLAADATDKHRLQALFFPGGVKYGAGEFETVRGSGFFGPIPRVSFAAQSGQSARRVCREEEALFRRANHRGVAAGRRRDAGRRRLSPGRDLRADVLPLEESVRRDAAQ